MLVQLLSLWIYCATFHRVVSSGTSTVEDTSKCIELSKLGKCNDGKMDEFMRKTCKDICDKMSQRNKLNFIRYDLTEKSFYDSTITLSSGERINFERYEGYFTLIIPVPKICEGKVKFSDMMNQINDLKQLSQLVYSVEIIVFPHEFQGAGDKRFDTNPTMVYEGKDCSDFDKEYKKKRTDKHPIHLMQLGNYTGDDIPPLWQLIENEMGSGTLKLETTAYFLIYPDLNKFEYHYGKSLLDMKDILLEVTKLMEKDEF